MRVLHVLRPSLMSFVLLLYLACVPLCWVCGYAAATRYSPRGGSRRRSRDENRNDIWAQLSTGHGELPDALRDEHDLADVAPLGDHVLRGAGFLEAEVAGDDRLDRAVVEQLAAAARSRAASVPRSFHSVSMFSPITAFESDICLIRLKRGMRTSRAAAP